jgi:hypothetical protein
MASNTSLTFSSYSRKESVTAAKGMKISRLPPEPRKSATHFRGHVKNGVPGKVELLNNNVLMFFIILNRVRNFN